ncbi:calsyntenin-2 [Sander lucioperca]|uniref:Calsyntenin-2 n=1 Tax=Sander lucioperca TaxID=283035 RepID=A0A8C9X5T5_SANLU|nr:calsyntenin-2 [Sander lucioperca]
MHILGVPFLLLCLIWGHSCALGGKVNKHKPWIETSYHGVITENMDMVLLDPPLVALDKDAPVPYAGEICAFKIYGQDAPFEAVVLNRTSGEGVLRASSPVDCESQKEYTFIIQAYDCGAGPSGADWKKSHKAVVHIQVDDVNEFCPVFREPLYKASVTEGKIYDSILQVEAWDQDCSPQYSQICNYEIVTAGTPFAIDRNGNIRNTERLSYDKQQSSKIMVTAFDCGQKRAKEDVAVHIDVKPVCKPGWQGWNKRVDYEPGTGSRQLFPKMHLETCGGPLSGVKAMVELQTNHIGKGCDRETYSENSLQKLCGAASGSTDLLPAPSSSSNWTAPLLTDSGRDSDLIYRFDGHQAANVPDHVVPQNLTDQFTIATWMKHGPSPGLRAEKETLLCNSDKTEMNRHHYSLYVHNCRLVFLLRRDFTQVDTFRPAEFHWKLEQICDKEWHYYVINVEFPAVTLFVDGVTYEPYLVTDDWPIHTAKIDTQLTVGACWQGGEVGTPRFTQYFRGSLSGLTIRPGRIETQKVISCLQACKEGLDINSLESLAKDIKFHFNPAQSVLVVEGEDLDSINTAMTKVSYINSRQFPTPGLRRLHITTTVQCFGEDTCLSIPDIKSVVMVLPPSEPRITITGSNRLVRPASDLRGPLGVAPFKELHITSTVMKADSFGGSRRPGVMEVMHNLDYCDVLVIGEELNPERESLEIHHSVLLGKHLDATNSTSGISIYGVDSMAHYEQALRQVRYRNWRPATLSERRLRLTCSELNGRYTSNEFNLEVSVLHHSAPVEHVNHMAVEPQYMRPVHHPLMIHTLNTHMSGAAPPAATAVIVVCIAALVVIVVIGVYRIHATHQEGSREDDDDEAKDTEEDWDNSALNITVNPMENVGAQACDEEVTEEVHEEEEEEEEQNSDEDGGEEKEREEVKERKQMGKLEWDSCSITY